MSGTFSLTFNGQSTAPIAWNASAATIQAAFQALSSVGAGNAIVTVGPSNVEGPLNGPLSKFINVAFQGALSFQALPRLGINTAALVRTGGFYFAVNMPPAPTVNGQIVKEKQNITNDGLTSGTWQIAYGNELSAPLSFNISDFDLKTALNGFAGIDNVNVSSYSLNSSNKTFQVEFGGTQAGLDMARLQVDTSNLIGGDLIRTISTNYNTASEVLSVIDPSSTVSFARDNMGRATTVATTIAGLGQSVALNQAFDAASNRTELRATVGSTSDFKNTYTYDKLRRLTDVVQAGQSGGNAVVSKHIAQAFNAASQRTNITRYQSTGTANLVASTNFTYDTIGRLSGIQHQRQGAVNLNTYSYTYDGMSRLKSVTSTAEGTTNFSYDSSSQLKSATGTQPTESYSYDENGNRSVSSGYVTGADNRTTSDPNFNYLYDAEGNLTRKTSKTNSQNFTTYQYDHRNRLTRVEFGNISTPNNYVNYEYDAFNRLVRRLTVPAPSYVSEATYWVYDEGINPVLELTNNFSGNGYLTHRYLWSNYVDELLADEQVNPSNNTANTVYPLADHQGTIRDIADYNEATGITAIANHRVYNSFGKLISETGTTSIVFGYTGKLYDKTTGLQNNWNRWYDPNLGKWISQDPIGFRGGDPNLYRFVGNAPTMGTDPSGFKANWHHLLPQAKEFQKHFIREGIDIHDKAFGWIIDSAYHTQDAKNLHNSGWNSDWRKFFDNNPNAMKADILDQVQKMRNKYDHFLKNGKQAAMSYSSWQKLLSKQRRLAAKAAKAIAKNSSTLAKAGKVGRKGGKLVKIIPGFATFAAVASWGVDGYCKGAVYGTVNTGVDAIPIVGNVKCLVEIFTGDFIPDYEEPSDPADELTPEEQAWIEEYGEPELEEMIESE